MTKLCCYPQHKIQQLSQKSFKSVVYFDQLLGAACTQKLVEQHFQLFSSFFVHFKPFSVISRQRINKKRLKMNKKTCFFFKFCLLLKAGRHVKACWFPEGVPQNCLFWFIFSFLTFFVSFWLISVLFCWFYEKYIFCSFSDVVCWFLPWAVSCEITEKGLKWTK